MDFNDTLSKVLDTFAPLKKTKRFPLPSSPWYNSKLYNL